jgi:hypothetical protein
MTGPWWAGDAPAVPPAWQTWLPALIGAVVVAVVGAVGTVVVKRMNRRLDQATTVKTEAETKKAAAETVSIEVQTARGLLAEVRTMMSEQREAYEQQIAMVQGQSEAQIQSVRVRHEADMRAFEARLGGVEKAFRRHAEWDDQATTVLRQVHPDFPDPPPVTFD